MNIHPLILIGALMVAVGAAIGLMVARVLRRMRASPQHRRHCPSCQAAAQVLGYGRFRCTACGHRFVLNIDGRPVTLLAAARVPFAVWLLVGTLMLWEASRQGRFWSGVALFAVLSLISLGLFLGEKRFKPEAGN